MVRPNFKRVLQGVSAVSITNKRENTIEKFTGKLEKEDSGFTMMLNDTIQNITNIDALAIYSYLSTKPSGWHINTVEISKHFNIGRDKTRKAFSYLTQMGLLIPTENRHLGKIIDKSYRLKLRIQKPGPENQFLATTHASPPGPENPGLVNQGPYKTKNITKQRSTPIVPYRGRFYDFLKTWNNLATEYIFTPVDLDNNRELRKIENGIIRIIDYWPELNKKPIYNLATEIEFSVESFGIYLKELIKLKWFMLCGDNPPSMSVILRQSNFAKGVLFIKKQQQKDNN